MTERAEAQIHQLVVGSPLLGRKRTTSAPSAYFSYCAGFRTPACRDYPRALAASVGKAPRQEIAVGVALAVRRALWGFGRGLLLEEG